MNDLSRAFSIEKKLAYIRVAATMVALIVLLRPEIGANHKTVKYLVIAGFAYSAAVLPLVLLFREKIGTVSKIVEITDLLFITAAQCFTGIDSYFTQLYLLFIIGAALRFNFKHVIGIAAANIILMLGANQFYHINSGVHATFLGQVQMHFQWIVYIVLTSVISGLIMGEIRKEKQDNENKQQRLLDARILLHKFNLFIRKVNQAEQLLFMRDSDIGNFITVIAEEIADITTSSLVYLTVFDKYGEMAYFTAYPSAAAKEYPGSGKDAKECSSLLRFIVTSFPNGLLLNDVNSHPVYSELKNYLRFGRNAACGTAALKNGSNIIIFASSENYQYSEVDLSMMQSFCLHMGFALENKEINELQLKKSVIENELKITSDIQKVLLPSNPLIANNIWIGGYCHPSKFVSGDYIDYFLAGNGKLYSVIADIMGEGLPSGFISLGLRSALRIIAGEEDDAGRILGKLNKHLCENYGALNFFVTMGIAVVDFNRGKVNVSSAGHLSPMIWVDNRYIDIRHGDGMALGIEDVEEYSSMDFDIRSKVLVLSYTDGITEAQNNCGERFGKERLKNSVEAFLTGKTKIDNEELVNKIKQDVLSFTASVETREDWSILISNFM